MKFRGNVTSDEESEYSDNEDAFDDEENAAEASGQDESSGGEEEEVVAEAEEAVPSNEAQEAGGSANSPEPQMMPSKVVKDSASASGSKKSQSTKSMIEDAIRALNEPRGSSFAAIKKYITAQQDKPPVMGLLKKTLLKSVNDGVLQQTKGTGCNGSFKISPALEKAKMQAEKKKEREMEKERAKKLKMKEKEEKKAMAKKEKAEAKAKAKKTKKENPAKSAKQMPAEGDTPTTTKKATTKKKIQPKGTKNSAALDQEKPVPKSLKGQAKKTPKAKPKAEKAAEPADDPVTSTSKVAAGKKRRLAPNSSPIKKMARKSIGSLAMPKTMTSKQIAKKASRVAKGRQPSAG